MMKDVINGVPREMMERINNHLHITGDFDPTYPPRSHAINESARLYLELSALLSEQPQASAARSAPAGEREAFEAWWPAVTFSGISPDELASMCYSAGAAWQRTQSAGVPDVSAMARALSDRSADACGVNRDDNWNLYSDWYIEDVQAMLAACKGPDHG